MKYMIFLVVLPLSLLLVVPEEVVTVELDTPSYVIVEPEFPNTEIACLAQNIFYESLGEPYEGKLAVATVTMNRVRHKQFPNTICEVVYQSNSRGCQFSWTCGPKTKFNNVLYLKHYEIAERFLTDDLELDRLKNALYFHANYVSPNWHFARKIEQIGNHIFYEVNS